MAAAQSSAMVRRGESQRSSMGASSGFQSKASALPRRMNSNTICGAARGWVVCGAARGWGFHLAKRARWSSHANDGVPAALARRLVGKQAAEQKTNPDKADDIRFE